MSIADKLTTIAENVQKVYEAGKAQGGGDSIEYSSITYNEDDTITLIETNGTVHTMTCEYEDGKLVSLKYGDKAIDLTYDNDVLIGVDDMAVDVSKAPATSGGIQANGSVAYPFVEELENKISVVDYLVDLV